MANVSQRNRAAILGGVDVSARHSSHLRSSACGLSSFLDWRIRDHQVLGRLPSHFSNRGDAHMIKTIKSKYVEDVLLVSVCMIACLGLYLLAAYFVGGLLS